MGESDQNNHLNGNCLSLISTSYKLSKTVLKCSRFSVPAWVRRSHRTLRCPLAVRAIAFNLLWNVLTTLPDSFDTSTSNNPFPSPTAPAPGPSLLDDNESKFLDSFFDGVSNDHFNYDFFNNGPDGSELGLGWDELPPAFMGTTSSFGQQPPIGTHGTSNMNYNAMNPPDTGSFIPPPTTADVIAAATLLQNGSNGRSQSISDATLFRQNQLTATSQPRAMSMSQHVSSRQQGFQQAPISDDYMRDNFYRDMVFGSQTDGTSRQRLAAPQKVDIRWGSDAGFASPQGFIAPAVQDDLAAVERSHMHAIENAFAIVPAQMGSSAETTRPSSPARPHEPKSNQRRKSVVKDEAEDDEQASRPRKRRKNKAPVEDADEDEDDNESPTTATSKPQNPKKRKPNKKGISDSPSTDPELGHKRRKSTGVGVKPTRENLTEDQKRENHIKSEQKRRTLIREGFEDLGELVPGLRGGGFSKSAVLIMSADWLEDLIQGNKVLQARLDQMEGTE